MLTTRERMEMHRTNPTCNSCHPLIDPIGLALENFDVTGKWRDRENGMPLDTRGELLRRHAAGDAGRAARGAAASVRRRSCASFTENLMTYALGRRVEDFDLPTVRAIAREAEAHGYRMSSFILGVVKSAAFRSKRADAAVGDDRRSGSTDSGRPATIAGDRRCSSSPARAFPAARSFAAMGATVALPFLDAMVPALSRFGRRRARPPERTRLVCIEMVHGAAGCNACGASKNLWAPAGVGRDFDLDRRQRAAVARAVPRLPDDRQQHRRAQGRGVHAAGDRRRPLPLERGVPDAVASRSRRRAPTSAPARRSTSSYAQQFGQDTPIPSMQLCIENVDQAGGCSYGYSCVYTDTISWASPDRAAADDPRPAHGVRQLFGAGAHAADRAVAAQARTRASSTGSPARSPALKRELGPADRARLDDYLDDVREIERRIQAVEARNTQRRGARAARRAGRRARLVRRAREADVRPAGAGVRSPT